VERLQEHNVRLEDETRRLEGDLRRVTDRAEDLRSQLARAVEREVTGQALLQQQLATLSGALAQLTGSRQPAPAAAESTGGEARHDAA
jgi:DNA repair exonuclease SbcCD ATPase subunit